MSKNVTNPMKVITGPNTRWSYVNAWEPKSINGGTPKYSVSLIIPKSDTKTLEKIKAALDAAYHEGEAKLRGNGKSVPPMTSLKLPLGMVTLKDPTMRRTGTATSSTPMPRTRPVSWMRIATRFSPAARCIPACTAEPVSRFTLSTRMAIVALPVV